MKSYKSKSWARALGVGVFCSAAALSQSVMAATTADIVFVVDESGSMGGEHAWLAGMVTSLDAALNTATVTGNQYGLIGYGGGTNHTTGHGHDVGGVGSQWGTAAEASTAMGGLLTNGSFEDGYEAMKYGFDNYSTRSGAAVNYILVTDEDRDVTGGSSITYTDMVNLFDGKNALLNVVVNSNFSGTIGNGALGVDSDATAYRADGSGGFTTEVGGTAGPGFGSTVADYVNLAFATGGAGWDLNQLRAGGLTADSFTAAFVDVKVGEIIVQPPADVPLPAAAWLFGSGLLGLIGIGRRKKA